MPLASSFPVPSAPSGTWPAIAGGLALTAALALATAAGTAVGALGATVAVAVYAVAATVVGGTIGRGHGAPAFGLPNTVTLVRLVAAALVAGYLAEVLAGLSPRPALAEAFAALAATAILADGVDGWLARRRGPATAFGARFDMEVDALLIAVLSILAYALGKAGAWVIAVGAMRYAFVAAGLLLPWLDAPLPPSFRRKAVCVLQGASLVLLMLPAVSGPPAAWLAAGALAALTWSFAVDIAWLARNRPR